MPGMAFPEIRIPEIPGIKIYRNRAVVNDKLNRGSLIGERMDSLTYVCQEPGNYQLPTIEITWWDLDQQQLKTITLPEASFEVVASPHSISATQETPSSVSWKWLVGATILPLILGTLAYFYKKPLQERWNRWLKQLNEGEAAYFKRITSDLTPARMLNAIQQWLIRVPSHQQGSPLESLGKNLNLPALSKELQSLQSAIVSQPSDWNGAALVTALKAARQELNQKGKLITNQDKHLTLKELNPK